MQTLSLHSLSRALAPNFAPRFSAQFWRNRQNTKCSGFSIDISLNSDIIESHQLNASQDCFAGASCERGTRLNCTQIERRRNTMKIIKRNGAEVAFDIQKIERAITKANNSVPMTTWSSWRPSTPATTSRPTARTRRSATPPVP